MKISFYRGDNHQVKFKFKDYTGVIDEVYFTVKCSQKYTKIKKKMNEGIEYDGEYYVITFTPEDTEKLDCNLNMVYDIEVVVNGEVHTVIKDEFILLEDVTTPNVKV